MPDWKVEPPKEEEPNNGRSMKHSLSVLRGHAHASDLGDSAMIFLEAELRRAKRKLYDMIESLEQDEDGSTDNDLLILDLQDLLGILEGPRETVDDD